MCAMQWPKLQSFKLLVKVKVHAPIHAAGLALTAGITAPHLADQAE